MKIQMKIKFKFNNPLKESVEERMELLEKVWMIKWKRRIQDLLQEIPILPHI